MRLFDPNDPDSPEARKYVLSQLQPLINRYVTEDLLGPGWRRKNKEEALREDHALTAEVQEETLSPFTCAFLDDSRLSSREKQLLRAVMKADTIAEAARQLEIEPSTARSMFMRIRKKLTN